MNLKRLYTLQNELNEKINEVHNTKDQNMVFHKILSLQVELGELANETRCFKYWSLKKPSNNEIILEEFVDCLHFILSIGLELGFDNLRFKDLDIKGASLTANTDLELTHLFLKLFEQVNLFKNDLTFENYRLVFENLLNLSCILGFEISDVENGYYRKNKINHKRQEEGY